jgi:outer membrane protein OmpA-like peptidoglycan-associated protein
MKTNIINKLVIFISFCLFAMNVNSQQVNTMYFMDNVPYRNYLNPALQPYSNFYLGFPVIGFSQFGFGNNSLTLKDFAYKDANGNPILFLNPNGSVDNFYNALNAVTSLKADVQLNLLTFGFRTGRAYWNFSITEKEDAQVGFPKDFMKLLLYGTPDQTNNTYDLKNLGFDMSVYTEIGLGYARKINDKWDVGAKLKFLAGSANINTSIQNLDLQAGIDQWSVKGQGSMNVSIPGNLTIGNNFSSFSYNPPTGPADFIQPSGMGAGIDIGLTFKPIKQLTVSAALIDLGFINWNSNTHNIGFNTDYTFTGLGTITANTNIDPQVLSDSILNALKNSAVTTNTTNAYTTYTSPKLNVGIEYGFFDNRLTLGLLSRTIKHNSVYDEELTASINGKPIDWFDLSASYSIFNGRMSNIGVGLGLRSGILHWFLAADYVPLHYGSIDLGNGSPIPTAYVPYNTKGVNVAFGISFVFGNRKDADKDGVVDRKDKCPDTPFGVIVDKKGCPVDTDGDGVPDYLDKCPGTPPEAYSKIDEHGCPLDTDGDGVPDYLDKCPDTPKAAIGFTDKDGCSLDTDKDGVPDYMDKCPDTPAGVAVDSAGCPFDTDGDGVPDYKDLCPETPKAAIGMVDKNGCPLDTDGDGVPDYLDLCPNTPLEAHGFIDKNGCVLDTDGDGVPDYLDKCANTPIEARGKVDQNGCPRDIDGDGIPDYLDKCPSIPGVAENNGCPEVKKEVKALFKKALQGIQFETGKADIKPFSFPLLNQIANILILNPTYLIEIQGHTDNVGKPEMNLNLSDRRAESVRQYLISKGIDEKRMTSHGYGDTKPVATNKTSKGRALNRRVEFVVTFEEVKME